MKQKGLVMVLSLTMLLSMMAVVSLSQPVQGRGGEVSPLNPERTGAWVDTVQIRTVAVMDAALDELEAGTLDLYTTVSSEPALYQRVQNSGDLVSHVSIGDYNELSFNPAGPVFTGTGKLNPFAVPEIREATNWLVDRGHIVQQIMGGMGASRYSCLTTSFPDYARYAEAMKGLEADYAYDYARANAAIEVGMLSLGATRVNGQWRYNGEPVTLIFLIRVEDERRQIGDYVADQLEGIGFAVDRQYKTSAEASPIWLRSDPNEGLWHIYTGGWMTGTIERDQGGNFQFFYTPSGYPSSPLWQAYTPSAEFQAIADRLASRDYTTLVERKQLFVNALAASMLDSVRIFLSDRRGFSPRRAETTAAYDLAGGLAGSDLWPHTLRFTGQEGGVIRIAQADNLGDAWNPAGGSDTSYDRFAQRATRDEGVVTDPNNGLAWPQRIASATVTVQAGLPVSRTFEWVTLEVSPSIEVPSDAWVDWDATNQVWITAAEKFTETQTARIRSVVGYPTDLFSTVSWHDGSPLSLADFVMALILPFDAAKPESAIYDESRVDTLENFLSTFKGYRIRSTDPLVVEYYTDFWNLDAELNVYPLWPDYGRGEGAWHTMAMAALAEADEALAFTRAKADALEIEWLDLVGSSSVTLLEGYLDLAQTMNLVPYANTLAAYITPGEATARWANLQTWYAARGHFWVGTGPFYLDAVSHQDNTLTLQRFADFPDPAGKWDHFSHDPSPPALALNYETGAPGSAFNVVGSGFPIYSLASVSVNRSLLGSTFTGESGTFTVTLTTDGETDEGYYVVTASVNPSASKMFRLDAQEPVRPVEGSHESYEVPDGIAIAGFVYLPLVHR